MSHQFRNHRVGCFVGIPDVVHTFRDNVLFVYVCNNRGDGVLVDRKLEFILAPGNFVFRVEFFLSSGRVERVILGFQRAGLTARLQSKALSFVTRRA